MKPSDQKTSTKVKVYVSKKCFLKSPHGILVRISFIALSGHFHSSSLILTFNPKGCSAWGPTLMAKKPNCHYVKKNTKCSINQNKSMSVHKVSCSNSAHVRDVTVHTLLSLSVDFPAEKHYSKENSKF